MKKLFVLMFAFGITLAGAFAAEPVKAAETKPANSSSSGRKACCY